MTITKDKPDDQELVKRYLVDDRQAHREILNIILPIFYREATYAARLISSGYDPDDMVSELCLAFLANGSAILSHWEPTLGLPLQEYIRTWARFRSKDVIWKHAKSGLVSFSDSKIQSMYNPETRSVYDPEIQSMIENDLSPEDLEDSLIHKADYEALLGILGKELNAADQQLLVSLFIEEKSVPAVATELGITSTALYQRTFRLRRYIREVFARIHKGKDDL
jgi:RNA polymerase sigma factor (sigma-70 family)